MPLVGFFVCELLTLDSIVEQKEQLEQECGQLKALVQELESKSFNSYQHLFLTWYTESAWSFVFSILGISHMLPWNACSHIFGVWGNFRGSNN